MTSSSEPIIVEQSFEVSPSLLWQAITEHSQMIQWFFDNIPEFRTDAGFKTEFNVRSGDRDFHHLWTIIESTPEQKIVYDWRYKDLPGVGRVTFEVFPEANGAMLRLTNEGLDSFPSDIPEFSRDSCQAGWEYFIQGNLQSYLNRVKQ